MMKSTKAKAMKECDPVVKSMSDIKFGLRRLTKRFQNLQNVLKAGLCPWPGPAKTTTEQFRIA